MKTTRQKRPDRVICKWGKYEVELRENNDVKINNLSYSCVFTFIPLKEIPNLIKALGEIQK